MKLIWCCAGALLMSATVKAMNDPVGAPSPLAPAGTALSSSTSVGTSTTPIGSPYYRYLAYDFDIPIKELVKFERKGFGRVEIVEIILIANAEDKPIKELGNRRIKDHVPMETLAKEAGLNYREVVKVAREIKEEIESRDLKDLPPAVYDSGTSSGAVTNADKNSKKNQDQGKKL